MKPQPKAKSKIRQSTTAPAPGALAPQDQNAAPFVPKVDQVAHRAYLNYQNHGAADGHDVGDWLRAESELVAEHHTSERD